MKYIAIAALAGAAVPFAGAASAQQRVDFSKAQISCATCTIRCAIAIEA